MIAVCCFVFFCFVTRTCSQPAITDVLSLSISFFLSFFLALAVKESLSFLLLVHFFAAREVQVKCEIHHECERQCELRLRELHNDNKCNKAIVFSNMCVFASNCCFESEV